MELLILAVSAFILWLFFRVSSSNSSTNTKATAKTHSPSQPNLTKRSLEDIEIEAQAIAAKISTVAGLERLEERIDDTVDKLGDAATQVSERKLEHKLAVIERALEIAEDKEVKWMLEPEYSAFELLKRLKLAFKPLTEAQRDKYIASGDFTLNEFYGISLSVLRDEEDDLAGHLATELEVNFLPELIAFRKIIESKSTVANKSKKIVEWIEKNQTHEVMEEIQWWDVDTELSHAEAFFASEMGNDGLPFAESFYAKGYTTPEKCLEIDAEEFLCWHGVGPKTQESLIQYQEKIRCNLNRPPIII
jgi:hypothetical protein